MIHVTEHYSAVGLEDVRAFIRGEAVPPRSCWVTFDDGHPSVCEIGLPIMEEFSVPATLFVCPSVVDTKEPFWWQVVLGAAEHGIVFNDEVVSEDMVSRLKLISDESRRRVVSCLAAALERELGHPYEIEQITRQSLLAWQGSGRSIGNHTWDHPILNRCDASVQESQIRRAHDWLTLELGSDQVAFAYPNGDATELAKNTLSSLGYELGLLFDHRITSSIRALGLSRIRVNGTDRLHEFAARVSGAHPAAHGFLRSGRSPGKARIEATAG